MPKRLSCICLFSAWLCASGALLDGAQAFAWARMFAGYARTVSIREAAVRTMDPGKPCAICMAVRRAREAGQHHDSRSLPVVPEKMPLLARVQVEPFIFLPVRLEWPESRPALARSWHTPVPVPPPRTLT